jgi:heat shock protein HslJ
MPGTGKLLVVAVALIAWPLGLTGCSGDDHAIGGRQWRLDAWTLSSLLATDFTITATFADGEVSGRSGVNHYRGPVTLGPDHSVTFGRLSSTRMSGPEPAMRAERAYLALLAGVRAYRIAEGRLTLLDKGGNESLIFAMVD